MPATGGRAGHLSLPSHPAAYPGAALSQTKPACHAPPPIPHPRHTLSPPGMNWVLQHVKKNGWRGVVNMSLGGPRSTALNDAAQQLISAGIPVVRRREL